MSIWGLLFGGFMAVFLALEIPAALGWVPWPTLSRTVWRLQARFPIFGFVLGCLVGGLAIHFLGAIPACNP